MKNLPANSSLVQRKEELKKELNAIAEKEIIELRRVHYPAIKEKYEGKYFKSSNGYNKKQRWYDYTKVTEIKPKDVYDTGGNGITSHFKGWTFRVTSSKEIEISPVNSGYVHSLGREITEEEFNEKWNEMVDKINSL